jgi:ApbE superfamily uncharacterized protein (UPF0280 family)
MRQKSIHALDGGRILAEYGPMRLVISAWVGKLSQRNICISAAREAFSYFEKVATLKDVLSKPAGSHSITLENPIALTMVKSVLAVGEKDLTPLAAVAGTLADAVADFLFDRGMTKVVVNNGGDIAVRIFGDGEVHVGMGSSAAGDAISGSLLLDSAFSSWGVATSGLGGRSFTRGVASAVTILARTSSLADAAATAIANASFVADEEVLQKPADSIDPNTDIAGIPVTVKVGPLTEEKKEMAILKAMEKARSLTKRGVILGCIIKVQDRIAADAFAEARLVRN